MRGSEFDCTPRNTPAWYVFDSEVCRVGRAGLDASTCIRSGEGWLVRCERPRGPEEARRGSELESIPGNAPAWYVFDLEVCRVGKAGLGASACIRSSEG